MVNVNKQEHIEDEDTQEETKQANTQMKRIKTVTIKVKSNCSKEDASIKIEPELDDIRKDEPYDLHIYNIQRDPQWLEYINDFVDTNMNKIHFFTTKSTSRDINVDQVLNEHFEMYRKLKDKAKSDPEIHQNSTSSSVSDNTDNMRSPIHDIDFGMPSRDMVRISDPGKEVEK